MFWIFTFGLLTGLALDLFNAQQITKTKFSCEGRISGYYADVTSGCQVYHMCDGLGRQFSYTCPNATLFQQRMLICDHWYMVNCSRSEDDYSANLLIGQKKPFVEDSVINPYHRTPRPDLLSHPSSASEYNIIYRTKGDHDKASQNIVGAEEEDSTYDSNYFPPSHWSTAYSKSTTSKPVRGNYDDRRNSNQNNIYKTNYSTVKKGAGSTIRARPKAISFNSPNRNGNNFDDFPKNKVTDSKFNPAPSEVPVNYKSSFRATTPVFPLSVEESSVAPNDIGILPPESYRNSQTKINIIPETEQSPKSFEPSSLDSAVEGNNFPESSTYNIDQSRYNPAPSTVPVNYKSSFPATTPVFPLTVEESSVAPNDIGILPPIPYKNLKTEIDTPPPSQQPQVNFKSNFKATTPVYPTIIEHKNRDEEKDTSIVNNPLQKESQVNFDSNFKATTPVYPTSVEPTSPNPGEVGLLPPQSTNTSSSENEALPEPESGVPGLSLSIEPPKFDENYNKNRDHIETTAMPPSMFYEPPKFEPDFTSPDSEVEVKPGIEVENLMKSLTKEQWQNLRQRFHIPEYDFPLDDATRPSYDSVLNSFAAKPAMKK